jgi:hypothetical protein
VTFQPEISSGMPLLTVTAIVADVPTFDAASYAFDLSVCDPFVAVVVFHDHD